VRAHVCARMCARACVRARALRVRVRTPCLASVHDQRAWRIGEGGGGRGSMGGVGEGGGGLGEGSIGREVNQHAPTQRRAGGDGGGGGGGDR
jgi:hypothetical protein